MYICLANRKFIACTFSYRIRGQEKKFGSISCRHEEEFIGLHVNMENVETKCNGRRDKKEHVTMRSMQREVQRYRETNEKIMKSQGEILWIMNMLH
jgi:hypothetical protein